MGGGVSTGGGPRPIGAGISALAVRRRSSGASSTSSFRPRRKKTKNEEHGIEDGTLLAHYMRRRSSSGDPNGSWSFDRPGRGEGGRKMWSFDSGGRSFANDEWGWFEKLSIDEPADLPENLQAELRAHLSAEALQENTAREEATRLDRIVRGVANLHRITEPGQIYDHIAKSFLQHFNQFPVCMVSFYGENRRWYGGDLLDGTMQQQSRRPSVIFSEATGTGLCGNDSSINLQHEMEQFAQEMAEASMSGNVYTVSDLRKTRFANAKLVVAPPFLNFYAAAVLHLQAPANSAIGSMVPIGSVTVMDCVKPDGSMRTELNHVETSNLLRFARDASSLLGAAVEASPEARWPMNLQLQYQEHQHQEGQQHGQQQHGQQQQQRQQPRLDEEISGETSSFDVEFRDIGWILDGGAEQSAEMTDNSGNVSAAAIPVTAPPDFTDLASTLSGAMKHASITEREADFESSSSAISALSDVLFRPPQSARSRDGHSPEKFIEGRVPGMANLPLTDRREAQ